MLVFFICYYFLSLFSLSNNVLYSEQIFKGRSIQNTLQISDSIKENIDSLKTDVYDTIVIHTEFGGASWYGSNGVDGIKHTDGYDGKKSASGIYFDTHTRMAAHKMLPFGTLARITNLKNGTSTIVEIVDRGPYSKGRIIDLSWASKNELNMGGTTNVKLEVIEIRKNGIKLTNKELNCFYK